MNKYVWCVCDMDGTLLNSKKIITKENEEALKKLQNKGTEVMIASGRTDLMVKSYIYQLNLKGHIISCNGGLIRNITTGSIVYSNPMDKRMVKDILEYCFERNINFLVYTSEIVLSNYNNPRTAGYEKLNKELPADMRFEIQYIDNEDLQAWTNTHILKVLLVCDHRDQVDFLIDKFSKFDQLSVVSSETYLVDIMASNTSKGAALKILAEKTGVNLEKVIAIGDNYNDIELLQTVGMPIAVENSVEALKLTAKYITKSNEESGVAYAINHFILNEK